MSSYSEGQTHQLMEALEGAGFSAGDVTTLGQSGVLLTDLRGIFRGTHELKRKECPWREEDGVIYFSVTSNGRTGQQWIDHFGWKGVTLSDEAKIILLSPDFQPTSGVTMHIAIFKGMLFEDCDRSTSNIRDLALQRKLATPNAEVACLIRENFSDEDIEAMGLFWLITMHHGPYLLGAGRLGGGPWLNAGWGRPGGRWDRESGFAFLVPQVAS